MIRNFVLSGGGARGYAHIGVMQAFAENGINPGVISSTSAGSIASAFICDGYTPQETADIFREYKLTVSFRLKRRGGGFLSMKFMEEFLHTYLRSRDFESLKIPLYVCATNFLNGTQQVFSSGDLIRAILASSSIPVIFPPVFIDNVPYVDGGISSNLPVEPLLRKYTNIIGVHVNPLSNYNPRRNSIFSNLERALHFSIRGGVWRNKQYCTTFIEPTGLRDYGIFDIQKFDAIYQIGLQYTRQYIREHNMTEAGESASEPITR
jgi:NTE family protein